MSDKSKIQWTDSTHNFWQGCTKVSPGCAHCYAEARDKRFGGGVATHWGPGAPRVRSKSFDEPLKWNEKPWVCDACGTAKKITGCASAKPLSVCEKCDRVTDHHRRRVFSLSLGDWLDPEVPIEWLADMLDVIRRCPNLDFLLLTKRPELWRDRMEAVFIWADDEAEDSEIHEDFLTWLGDWINFDSEEEKPRGKSPVELFLELFSSGGLL